MFASALAHILRFVETSMFVFTGVALLQTEVDYLGQLHHQNLVKLIGYCSDGDNRLLVYEYMPKGSLENHLFRSMFFILMQPFSSEICRFLFLPSSAETFCCFRRC